MRKIIPHGSVTFVEGAFSRPESIDPVAVRKPLKQGKNQSDDPRRLGQKGNHFITLLALLTSANALVKEAPVSRNNVSLRGYHEKVY